jgi:hypothetical protein
MNTPNGLKTLAVHHIAEDAADCARIAISPGSVQLIASKDCHLNGRDLKQVTVHFQDGSAVPLTISSIDLLTLEEVIAGYSFGEDY